jgi:hypothetical protein
MWMSEPAHSSVRGKTLELSQQISTEHLPIAPPGRTGPWVHVLT